MADCTIRLPPLDELALRWHQAEPLLRRATSRTGCYEPIDLLRNALAGLMGIWFVEFDQLVTVAVTEVRQYPRKRVLEVPFIAGDGMRRWAGPLLAALDEHGRHCGCAHLVGSGRRGWARIGGFREDGPLLVRDL